MKTLLTSMVILALRAAALAAQGPAVPSSSPQAGSSARATVELRVEVLPSATASFARAENPTAAEARVEGSRIVVEGGQPEQLLLEVWEQRDTGALDGEARQLVLRAPLRLEPDLTGRASGRVPAVMARALEVAAARPNAYTVVVVY